MPAPSGHRVGQDEKGKTTPDVHGFIVCAACDGSGCHRHIHIHRAPEYADFDASCRRCESCDGKGVIQVEPRVRTFVGSPEQAQALRTVRVFTGTAQEAQRQLESASDPDGLRAALEDIAAIRPGSDPYTAYAEAFGRARGIAEVAIKYGWRK